MSDFYPNRALEAQLEESGLPPAEAITAMVSTELAVGRTCGPCVVCCRTVGVPELEKPPGTDCTHCSSADAGCSIYASRPAGCRVYACAWKLGFSDDDDRPDLAGGLLEWHELDPEFHPYGGHWVYRAAGEVPNDRGQDLIARLLGMGCLVLIYRGAGQPLSLCYPDGSEDPDAGIAPHWRDGEDVEPMGFQIAEYESYAADVDPEIRALIETGEPPFFA